MVADGSVGGAEPGSEGERADHPAQRPRRRRPPPFFYRRRFVRGPRPPDPQQQGEVEIAPLGGPSPPASISPPRRPFRPRPPQQPTTEGGDGETKPLQGPADSSRPEPQRPRNRPYFQRRRQQQPPPPPPGPRTHVTAAAETPAPLPGGDPTPALLE
uniref:Y-box binding protein 2 n=1 Tax=Ornithorhynchus anatinus TaxID=9258 RepID=A0A6I8NDP1_ORNAN